MDYNEALDYIDSFMNFEKIPRYSYASSFRLERMYAFLEALGNPHHGLKTIHIAGSKGKGSTCIIIASILGQAGYCVGLYTSPHLLDARERIRVLDGTSRLEGGGPWDFRGAIDEDEFIRLINEITPAAERFRERKELGRLSFFEILTACAFLYFKKKKVDVAILETGLGGRLDATNVTEPIVCGITNISLEHTDKLGSSLKEIAREKTGIIKARGLVVSASQEKEARDVIRKVSSQKKARLYEINKDITYTIIDSNECYQIFNLDGPGYSYKNLQLNLIGAHEVENAALAIAMIKLIDKKLFKIDKGIIRRALKDISWPGRLQIVQREPCVILDGAQNVASIKAVLSSVKKIFSYKKLICIFGISSDKDIKGVSKELDSSSDIVILTRSRNERAKDPIYLRENFSRLDAKLTNNVERAFKLALDVATREDLILVTGSFYVIGEAMRLLKDAGLCSRRSLGQRHQTGVLEASPRRGYG